MLSKEHNLSSLKEISKMLVSQSDITNNHYYEKNHANHVKSLLHFRWEVGQGGQTGTYERGKDRFWDMS